MPIETLQVEAEFDRFEHPCEAPIHADSCNGVGNTVDHFTPRAVGKKLGIGRKRLNEPDNLQYLSTPCHRIKDKDTPLRLVVLRLEQHGTIFTFEEHRRIFEEGRVSAVVDKSQ